MSERGEDKSRHQACYPVTREVESMQTPAEKHLVQQICDSLDAGWMRSGKDNDTPIPILNIGAVRGLSIEKQILNKGCIYVCDRIDIDDCYVAFATIRRCWVCSIEEMTPVETDGYPLAFANYVLENVLNPWRAAREISRVLRPSGIFVTMQPNPVAPEFMIARNTPLWFHKFVKQGAEVWETHYAYQNIQTLTGIFEEEGFIAMETRFWPFTEGYLW